MAYKFTKDKVTINKQLLRTIAAATAEIIMNGADYILTAYGRKTHTGIADLLCRQFSDGKITFEPGAERKR